MKLHRLTTFLASVFVLGSVTLGATLRVNVTAAAGRSVFIDHGRSDGVVVGARVRFTPAGETPSDGVVADVASNSARVDLFTNVVPRLGSPGEVEVPESPRPATQPTTRPTTAPTQAIPTHPPWKRQEAERSPDAPLLSPAFPLSPSGRPSTFHGRVYTDEELALDRGSGRDNRYLRSRTGTAFTLTNPFGQGGELNFDGEYDYRDATDLDSRSDLIINRLSYAIGTDAAAPYRVEAGRFTSYFLPEIGWVDGIEAAVRLDNGFSLGGGMGGYPRPFIDQDIGQDLGLHLFADYQSKGTSQLAGTIGVQQTWHNGSFDRSLLIARGSVWATKALWLYGSLTTDLYTSGDEVKSSAPQATTAWFQARYTPTVNEGASLSYSHFSWADIQSRNYPPVPLEIIRTGRVERLELAVWRDIVPNLRPTLRVNYFNDDRTSGFGGEADLDWSKIGGQPLTWHNAVFYAAGDYTDDYGFRTQLSATHGDFDANVGYEMLRSISAGTQTESGVIPQNAVRAGVGWQHGDWYYNVNADYYFGNHDEAYRVGARIEYRF